MTEIILYPTETIYGLGVNAFDEDDWRQLCLLKGRDERQTASWLVGSVVDIERFAVVTDQANDLIERFLPGPVTLVLQARNIVPEYCLAEDGTVAFRLSSDPLAQKLIVEYLDSHNGVPLTCTSANVHGLQVQTTVEKILEQFGTKRNVITRIIDGGKRDGRPSTVVRCVGEGMEVLREGALRIFD